PSFGTSAGARFTVIRLCGTSKPVFLSAAVTRSRPSRTAPCASPTTAKLGSPEARWTSTRTGNGSTPRTAAVCTCASMEHARARRRARRWEDGTGEAARTPVASVARVSGPRGHPPTAPSAHDLEARDRQGESPRRAPRRRLSRGRGADGEGRLERGRRARRRRRGELPRRAVHDGGCDSGERRRGLAGRRRREGAPAYARGRQERGGPDAAGRAPRLVPVPRAERGARRAPRRAR